MSSHGDPSLESLLAYVAAKLLGQRLPVGLPHLALGLAPLLVLLRLWMFFPLVTQESGSVCVATSANGALKGAGGKQEMQTEGPSQCLVVAFPGLLTFR